MFSSENWCSINLGNDKLTILPPQEYHMPGASLAAQWLWLCYHCRGHRFGSWLGKQDPTYHQEWPKN